MRWLKWRLLKSRGSRDLPVPPSSSTTTTTITGGSSSSRGETAASPILATSTTNGSGGGRPASSSIITHPPYWITWISLFSAVLCGAYALYQNGQIRRLLREKDEDEEEQQKNRGGKKKNNKEEGQDESKKEDVLHRTGNEKGNTAFDAAANRGGNALMGRTTEEGVQHVATERKNGGGAEQAPSSTSSSASPSSNGKEGGDDHRKEEKVNDKDVTGGSEEKVMDEDIIDPTLPVIPIGHVRSVFQLCVGTPRQGLLAPHAKGRIEFDPSLLGPDCVDGLDSYSHVWIVFVFHLNSNQSVIDAVLKGRRKEKNKDGTRQQHHHSRFPSKVSPPALGGKRVGLFGTRTPHRPNPIGFTLCKLDRVEILDCDDDFTTMDEDGEDDVMGHQPNRRSSSSDKDGSKDKKKTNNNKSKKRKKKKKKGKRGRAILHVSGIDLVDGTPVIDIKPYVPHYDSIGLLDEDASRRMIDSNGTEEHVPVHAPEEESGGEGDDADGNKSSASTESPHGPNIPQLSSSVSLPDWVTSGLSRRRPVHFTDRALTHISKVVREGALDFYRVEGGIRRRAAAQQTGDATNRELLAEYEAEEARVAADVRECIREVLAVDVRSAWQTGKVRRGASQAERAQRLGGLVVPPPATGDNDIESDRVEEEHPPEVSVEDSTQNDPEVTEIDEMPKETEEGDGRLCTQQIDNLLVYFSVAAPPSITSNDEHSSAAWGSGASDSVMVKSVERIIKLEPTETTRDVSKDDGNGHVASSGSLIEEVEKDDIGEDDRVDVSRNDGASSGVDVEGSMSIESAVMVDGPHCIQKFGDVAPPVLHKADAPDRVVSSERQARERLGGKSMESPAYYGFSRIDLKHVDAEEDGRDFVPEVEEPPQEFNALKVFWTERAQKSTPTGLGEGGGRLSGMMYYGSSATSAAGGSSPARSVSPARRNFTHVVKEGEGKEGEKVIQQLPPHPTLMDMHIDGAAQAAQRCSDDAGQVTVLSPPIDEQVGEDQQKSAGSSSAGTSSDSDPFILVDEGDGIQGSSFNDRGALPRTSNLEESVRTRSSSIMDPLEKAPQGFDVALSSESTADRPHLQEEQQEVKLSDCNDMDGGEYKQISDDDATSTVESSRQLAGESPDENDKSTA